MRNGSFLPLIACFLSLSHGPNPCISRAWPLRSILNGGGSVVPPSNSNNNTLPAAAVAPSDSTAASIPSVGRMEVDKNSKSGPVRGHRGSRNSSARDSEMRHSPYSNDKKGDVFSRLGKRVPAAAAGSMEIESRTPSSSTRADKYHHHPHASSPVAAINNEKCRFWPACTAGDACPYVHPSKACPFFPNCKHGDKCIFIHPLIPCRFGVRCTNPTCSYQHPASAAFVQKGMVPAHLRAHKIPCRFGFRCRDKAACSYSHAPPPCRNGPNCPNVHSGCSFHHAQPCRDGTACTRPGCYFAHPYLTAAVNNSNSSNHEEQMETMEDAGAGAAPVPAPQQPVEAPVSQVITAEPQPSMS